LNPVRKGLRYCAFGVARTLGVALSIVLLLSPSGCSRQTVQKADSSRGDPPGQWILASYNEKTGYAFRKDGVIYQTNCAGVNYGYGKGAEPPTGQSSCAPVLLYMHHPVPSLHLGFLDKNGTTVPESEDTLYYVDGGRQYLFEIIEAK
jgi:hypothetical protein